MKGCFNLRLVAHTVMNGITDTTGSTVTLPTILFVLDRQYTPLRRKIRLHFESGGALMICIVCRVCATTDIGPTSFISMKGLRSKPNVIRTM